MLELSAPSPAATVIRRLLLLALAAVAALAPMAVEPQAEVILSDEAPRAYLDLTDHQAANLGISAAVGDLLRFTEEMTGRALPRRGGQPALFDPTGAAPLRVECVVDDMSDLSRSGASNAQAGITLTPTRLFSDAPFAGPGEKVGVTCAWHRQARRLEFALSIANQAYYGPGHGPFTAATWQAEVPDFTGAGRVTICLEIRGGDSAGVRAGSSVDEGEWTYTEWFDPTAAGADDREPGVSDKNGPQGWGADWPARWSDNTCLFVTGYAPKDRQAKIAVSRTVVTQDGKTLFESAFTRPADEEGAVPGFSVSPREGEVSLADGQAVFVPDSAGWSTVGLRALESENADLDALLPVRLELVESPDNADPFAPERVQGFHISTGADGVTMRAETSLGLQNAIYYLLEQWGCRFVMPGEIGECIPRRNALALPAGEVDFAPRADVSVEASGRDTAIGEWYRRNMGGWQNWLSGQHYWLHAIPADPNFEAHPDWFALVGGERRPTQLCTSNPEVIARMTEVAKKWLAQSPVRMSFPMDPMDNLDFCQCPNCRALDPPDATTKGTPSVTDRVLAFANAVADGIREEFPDRYVACYSYWSHSDLPRVVKPRDNVIVIVCRSSHCLVHLTPADDCPTSDFHAFLRSWRELTPNIYAYEYDPISWTGGLPCPTYLEMAQSLKTQLGEIGVRGSYSDGRQYAGYAGTYINRYIARRMKVDPDQEPEAVLADMCGAFFGPAADQMQQYYLTLARVTEFMHPGRSRVGGGSTFYHEMFAPEIVQEARQHLDRALAVAGAEEPYAERLRMIDESQDQLEGYIGGIQAAEAGDFAGAEASFDRMLTAIGAMEERGVIDGPDARRRAHTMRMKTLAREFPEPMGFVTTWKLLGPFDNSSRDADMRTEPYEPLADIEEPVVLPDGATARWWEYESESGFLNLEEALAGKRGDWELSYAYAGATYEAEEAVAAQLRMDSFCPFKVFLNGEEVFYRKGLDADCPDKRRVDVRLRRGTNVIVFKLSQTQLAGASYPWGLYFRVVVDEDRRDLVVLPEEWAFRTDPEDGGLANGWQAAELDDGAWAMIPVPARWEDTLVGEYDGYGWYRVHFDLPAARPEGDIALVFTGVDEQAWVYLNGSYIGERTEKSTGQSIGEIWDDSFEIAVPPDALRFGATNTLAVRVHDSRLAGGIYGGVRLLVKKD